MLSLVLPTYNEAANITALVDNIDGVLQNMPHEVIVVDDDSPDGTWKVAEGLTRKHPALRVLRRVGRKGLSSAVMEGFDMAQGDVLAVMDADGQHDAMLLHTMLASLKAGAQLTISSRYAPGGSVGEWVTDRRIISSVGTIIAKMLSRVRVSDPLGGFFALRADLYKSVRSSLRPTGFKILLEILATLPTTTRVTEIPLIFRMRLHGHSKLSLKVHFQFVCQTLRLALRRLVSGACSFCGPVFWVTTVIMLAVIVPRIVAMHLLYTDSAVRAMARQTLSDAAMREGWLLSDMKVLAVGTGSLTILHQEHMRHDPKSETCILTYRPFTLTCDSTKS
ncbi:MAG: polyprenol monophosphomannose synthase [Candidatus Peribacteraceae bacterium]|nr:polyprenol monophosphomannose synthase [Candidatus Peribacteraceae bacterium]